MKKTCTVQLINETNCGFSTTMSKVIALYLLLFVHFRSTNHIYTYIYPILISRFCLSLRFWFCYKWQTLWPSDRYNGAHQAVLQFHENYNINCLSMPRNFWNFPLQQIRWRVSVIMNKWINGEELRRIMQFWSSLKCSFLFLSRFDVCDGFVMQIEHQVCNLKFVYIFLQCDFVWGVH